MTISATQVAEAIKGHQPLVMLQVLSPVMITETLVCDGSKHLHTCAWLPCSTESWQENGGLRQN